MVWGAGGMANAVGKPKGNVAQSWPGALAQQ